MKAGHGRREAHLFRLMVENTVDYAIFTTDTDGLITTWNAGAERILGFTEADVLGRHTEMIFIPQDRKAGAPQLEIETATHEGRAENERWHVCRDGSMVWGSGIMIPMREDDGTLVGFAKIFRDFTERRRTEEAVRQAQRIESVGVLAAGVAHDFNNLLTSILGNAALARRAVPAEGDQLAPLLDEIIAAGRRAADLTHQLLAYAGKGRSDFRAVDLCALISEIADLLRSSIPRNVELRFDLTDECPSVHGDPSQLQQVILNVALNGAEAMEGAPGQVTIGVRRRQLSRKEILEEFPGAMLPSGPYLCLTIADTGTGMPEGVRRRMYDPFFTTKFLGRGLGLSVVQGIVRTHRGAISVESAPGAGTKFQVALPVSGGPIPTEPVRTTERRQVPPLPSGSVVLVVDDEDMIRSLAQSILELGGYRVVQAENGQQAVEMVRRLGDQMGLVLLDLSMPVMDGAEALARIREIRPELPVLLMSGYGAGAIMERTAGAAHVEYLRKPFSPDGLMDAVTNFAGRSDR